MAPASRCFFSNLVPASIEVLCIIVINCNYNTNIIYYIDRSTCSIYNIYIYIYKGLCISPNISKHLLPPCFDTIDDDRDQPTSEAASSAEHTSERKKLPQK